MNTDATTYSYVSRDRLAWQRLAATRNVRHQIADAAYPYLTTVVTFATRRPQSQYRLTIVVISASKVIRSTYQLEHANFASANCRVHVVYTRAMHLISEKFVINTI